MAKHPTLINIICSSHTFVEAITFRPRKTVVQTDWLLVSELNPTKNKIVAQKVLVKRSLILGLVHANQATYLPTLRKSLQSSDAYMCQRSKPSLIQLVDWRFHQRQAIIWTNADEL